MAGVAFADPGYGISMSGALELPADFKNLPYVKPDAPKGGRIVYAETGTYDSFSPFITAGKTPYGFKTHVYESFLKRSVDESFSLYNLLADSVDMAADRKSVTFHLNPLAKFSDGSAITMDDIMWSYKTLAEKGSKKYVGYMTGVTIEDLGDGSIKFNMSGENRELPMLLGMMPIMKKSDFDGVAFEAGMTKPTIGSGAYMVSDFKMGESLTFKRNPDYWGKDLPVNIGQYNLDEIKYVYFADPAATFEAFKAGDVNIFSEGDPKRWDSYDFESFAKGDVIKTAIKHQRPTGYQGFVFNTRRAPLNDWHVRDALLAGFNFPFINKTINDGRYQRIESPFSNSFLASGNGPLEGKARALLEPFVADLPPGALDGYALPAGDETGRDRDGIAAATKMLEEAGFTIQDGVMKDKSGKPLEVSVSVKPGDEEKYASLWADGLKPMGVVLNIETVDPAALQTRIDSQDYDIIFSTVATSLSPGNEQTGYWGSSTADNPETRNYMGAKISAIDAMIDAMLKAENLEDYTAAVKALDRVVMAQRFIVPIWFNPEAWIVHDKHLKFPEYTPKYGYWPGFTPDAMYWEE